MSLEDRLAAARVVPVLTIPASVDAAALGAPLAEALAQAGVTAVEVTLRTSGAEAVLKALASNPGLYVGAGTVLDADQAERAHAAGAAFLVSPGLAEDVLAAASDLGLPAIPGVATATELMRALRHGISTVKLFPAEQVGGVATLKALAAPFPSARFMPTGGIGPGQLAGYLGVPQVLAVGGSWIAPADLLERGAFREIRDRAAHAVEAAAA